MLILGLLLPSSASSPRSRSYGRLGSSCWSWVPSCGSWDRWGARLAPSPLLVAEIPVTVAAMTVRDALDVGGHAESGPGRWGT